MAAGQQKKRLHASSVVSNDLHEHCSTKKKKILVSPQNFLNIKSHISLEWDDYRKKVVAKREQIGIQWRKLGPFINPLPPARNALADVIPVPKEVFGLEDLSEVLSYEVWDTLLSETEKSFLTQFLPKGADAEQAVQSLLTGANLHFGNPFVKWSDSLCAGKLHPDAILGQEQRFDGYKKAYDSEIEQYQNEYLSDDMMGYMQKLKETWMGREGPERDIVENMLRNGHADKNRNVSTPSERLKVASISRKEVKPQRVCVRSGDGAKYMSYFKITRKQHQLVKDIKQSDGIKSNSLNHILGDIGDFHVQPYDVYVEEERNKLHEHWLQVAKMDIPSAFTKWREKLIKKQDWSKSLKQELKDNQISVSEDEEENTKEERYIGEANESVMDTQNRNGDDDTGDDDDDEDGDDDDHHDELEPMNNLEEDSPETFQPEEPSPVFTKVQGGRNSMDPLQRIPSLNGTHDIKCMDMESDEGSEDLYEQEEATPVSKFVGPTEVVMDQRDLLNFVGSREMSRPLERIPSLNGPREVDPLDIELAENIPEIATSNGLVGLNPTNPKEAWLEMGLSDSYYNHTPINHGYVSSSDQLPLGHPQFMRQHQPGPGPGLANVIDLDAKESLLHKSSSEDMRQRLIPSHLGAHNVLLEAGHPPGHLEEQQQQLLKHRQQIREREYYMQQAAHKNMYPNNGTYHPSPSQQLLSPINVQNWGVDPSQVRGGWSGMGASSSAQGLGNGSNADGSLYSVLSQFNNTSSMGTPQGIVGGTSDGFAQTSYLRGLDQNPVAPNNTSWVNLQPQNPGLHDSLGKPFLRSWNL
ncbi:hypothetical protein ACHQM5_009295 [Ranunculus cassubicifolius]